LIQVLFIYFFSICEFVFEFNCRVHSHLAMIYLVQVAFLTETVSGNIWLSKV